MAYKIVYPIFYVLSLLPFRVLYGISDFFYLIMYHIVGYRKKVVRKNLSSSFPEKTPQELKEIDQMIQSFCGNASNVHARPFSYRFQSFQNGNTVRIICVAFCHLSILLF